LTRAIENGDADAMSDIYAPDATIWHCTDQVNLTVGQLQDLLRAIRAVAEATVTVKSLLPTDRGFVQTQELEYRFRSGTSTRFHAAMVADVDAAGQITRLEEYLDGAGLAPLIEALGAS
jgi:ketosteroid isomerase-like protein